MKNFFHIIYKLSVPGIYDKINLQINHELHSIIVNSFYSTLRYKSHWNSFEIYFLNNFVSEESREELLKNFNKTYRIYTFFNKFYLNYVNKKRIIYPNEHTLCLQNLNQVSQNKVIQLVQNDVVFRFYIYDLIQVIEKSLCFNDTLIVDPQIPKNPYTNLDFSDLNLYVIYSFIRINNMKIPKYFESYLKCNMNMEKFIQENENSLKIIAIKEYILTLSLTDKYFEIISLLYEFKENWNHIYIDIRYPSDMLVEIFSNQLEEYFIYKYTYIPSIKKANEKKMIASIKKKLQNNFHIGRIFSYNNLSYLHDSKLMFNKRRTISVSSNSPLNIMGHYITYEMIQSRLLRPRLSNTNYYIYTDIV